MDLRLFNPWDELLEFTKIKTTDISKLTDHQHGHIPYVLLLLHYLQEWKNEKGSFPSTYKEKNEFKKLVTAGMRTNVPGGSEENYEEAVAAVLNNVKKHEISRNLRAVFEDEKCTNLTSDSSIFWIIAQAIKKFVDEDGVLPLTGTLPDMKAESDVYVMLQKMYGAPRNARSRSCAKRKYSAIGKSRNMISREFSTQCKRHSRALREKSRK